MPRLLVLFAVLAMNIPLHADAPTESYFTTSDGVNLRVLDQGQGKTYLFVPGWAMPAEIFEKHFVLAGPNRRIVSFDPRSQGLSDKVNFGLDSGRRAKDIRELIQHFNLTQVVLVGWSLGALEVVQYLNQWGSDCLAGVVLLDNSVDRGYGGVSGKRLMASLLAKPYGDFMSGFVASMFVIPPLGLSLPGLTKRCLQTPRDIAIELLKRGSSGAGLRAAMYHTQVPVAYWVTERYAGQAERIKADLGDAVQCRVDEAHGHAFFREDPELFNRWLLEFAGDP